MIYYAVLVFREDEFEGTFQYFGVPTKLSLLTWYQKQ